MTTTKEKRLGWVLFIVVIIFIVEVVGGILSNSLALLSDAGHVLTDGFAIVLSLLAALIMRKPPDKRATFGYHRVGLVAAIINGLSLLGISIFIFFEAYERFISPPVINTTLMLSVAFGGLIGNIIMASILRKGTHDLNIKSAWLHIIGDLIASVGVLFSGTIIYFTKFYLADPLTSLFIGTIILVGGIRVVKESLWIFLELTPSNFSVEKISEVISEVPEVNSVHDIHLWSISHGTPAFSAHISLKDRKISEADTVREKIEKKLSNIGIKHSVLQIECTEGEDNMLYCNLHMPEDK